MSEYGDEEEAAPSQNDSFQTEHETDVRNQDRSLHIDTDAPDGDLPLPVWMRESAKNFKFRWVPLPLRKAGRAISDWVKGPDPPVQLHIEPWFPRIQEAPIKLLDRFAPKQRHRAFLLILVYCIWFLVWSLMIRNNRKGGYIAGYGEPSSLWCGASFW